MEFDTELLHGGISEDETTGAMSVPIYMASTFHQKKLGQNKYEYSRSGNPTRDALESLMATIEHGTAGFAFASGLAAISTFFNLFESGDHFVVGDDVYGGTFRMIDAVFKKMGMTFTTVDTRDLAAVEAAITPETKAVYLESPSNPLLKVTDIQAVAEIAKAHHLMTVVDNTFASPYIQHPLDLGADVVLHSASKYLGGHSDLIGGIIVTKVDVLGERVGYLQNSLGGILAPQESWLLQRGIKTLALRMRAHLANAELVFNYLKARPEVAKIYYPGDKDNPDYPVAKKQMNGFGAMISFELQPGLDPVKFVENLQVITLAESLGALESLIEIPALMTHGSIPREVRLASGIQDELIRMSVGVEDSRDLIADLDRGFDAITK